MSSLSVRQMLTNSMLFYPTRGQSRTPEQLGLAYERIELTGADGVRTEAWWIPAAPGEDESPVLLFFHGNAGTMADRLENTLALHELGLTVMPVEYRGYGNSDDPPSEEGLYADAAAALAEARKRAGKRSVLVFGRSLGGAVAIDLASKQSVDGLIVESTFTSLPDMAGRTGIPLASHLVAYEFASIEKIGRIEAPLLMVHGDRDEVVPFEMGLKLRDAATKSRKVTFHPVMHGTHNDTWVLGGEPYWKAWRAFIALYLRADP